MCTHTFKRLIFSESVSVDDTYMYMYVCSFSTSIVLLYVNLLSLVYRIAHIQNIHMYTHTYMLIS